MEKGDLRKTRPLKMEIKKRYRDCLLGLAVGWHACASRYVAIVELKYRNNIINVIAPRFLSILCPVKNNPTAMDQRIIPVKRLKSLAPRKCLTIVTIPKM